MQARAVAPSVLLALLFVAPLAAARPTLVADLTFDTHMYAFRDTVTPYFGAGLAAAARDAGPLTGTSALVADTGIVTGLAVSPTRGFRDVLVPLCASASIGIEADGRFGGWIALRIGTTANIVAGWGADLPWSVGIAGGVATRISGPVHAILELASARVYPGGINGGLVSTRAGLRYAPGTESP